MDPHARRVSPRIVTLLLIFLGVGSALFFGLRERSCVSVTPLSPAEVTHGLCGGDFRIFWAAAHYAAEGDLTKARDDASLKALPPLQNAGVGSALSLYPPSFLLLMEPLGAKPFPQAWLWYLWGSLTLFFLGVIVAAGRDAILGVALAAGYGGLWLALDFGQSTLALTGLYLLVMAALPRREVTGGVLIGLASIKPHLGLLVPLWLGLRRHGAVIFWACCVVGLLVLAVGERYGWSAWTSYLQDWRKPGERLLAFQTVRPEAMASVYAGLRFAGVGVAGALVGQLLVGALALRLMIRVCRTSLDPRLPLAATIAATLLVVPHVYGYDLLLLFIPLLVLVDRAGKRGWALEDVEAFLPAYLAPAFTVDLNLALRFPVMPLITFLLLHRLTFYSRYTAD